MIDIRPFCFDSHQVRVILHDGEPWFVAKDVCAVLELQEPHRSLAALDEDEKGGHTVTTPGGPQKMTVINEPGLYSLIFRSRKPEAKRFKRWVTHEVLPAIRKNGRYATQQEAEQETETEPTADLPRLPRVLRVLAMNTA